MRNPWVTIRHKAHDGIPYSIEINRVLDLLARTNPTDKVNRLKYPSPA